MLSTHRFLIPSNSVVGLRQLESTGRVWTFAIRVIGSPISRSIKSCGGFRILNFALRHYWILSRVSTLKNQKEFRISIRSVVAEIGQSRLSSTHFTCCDFLFLFCFVFLVFRHTLGVSDYSTNIMAAHYTFSSFVFSFFRILLFVCILIKLLFILYQSEITIFSLRRYQISKTFIFIKHVF